MDLDSDLVFIDVRTSNLTLIQVLKEIERLKMEYPDYEIILDGDTHKIIGRAKV